MASTTTNDQVKDAKLTEAQFRQFRDLIYRETGICLAENKRDFVQSRLSKRLRVAPVKTFSGYFKLVTNSPDGPEMQEMINRITTNKTHFFREMHHFNRLKEVVFPRLVDEANKGLRPRKLRIWCAASSSGEEPYSLAIAVHDFFSRQPGWDIRILASDIDTKVLDQARSAKYHEDQMFETPPELLNRYLIKGTGDDSDRYVVVPEAASLVTFKQVNLLGDEWPIHTRFDAIFCRNVLIYFDQETQDTLMRRMAQYLMQDGSLFIGHSESLARLSDVYVRVGKTVYQHAGVGQPAAKHAPKGSAGGYQTQQAKPAFKAKLPRKAIVVGDVFTSKRPHEVSTTLGSCIAVCLWDNQARLGGMNHFALPSGVSCHRKVASFGVHAMELLINQIMGLGGDRRRFQAKVFGGAHVLSDEGEDCVGTRNGKFIKDFLETENIPIASEYLGGDRGMKVLFETHTGRARMKLLDRTTALEANKVLMSKPTPEPEPAGDITLF